MPVPHRSEDFGDLLDPRFQRIYDDRLRQLDDRVFDLHTDEPNNGRNEVKYSSVGTLDDWDEFDGEVAYDSVSQGYDVSLIPVEFTKGTQVRRKLFDDDQFSIMDQKPRAMALSYHRTRQRHAARMLNNGFAVDTMFHTHSENVALCSNSHTTTSGASTAAGFDNLLTDALTAVALETARLQMRGFRGDRAERISVKPDEVWIPVDLEEKMFEINASRGKLDTANNNANFHEGKYQIHSWEYLTDTNDWWLSDMQTRKENVFWQDRVKNEFAMVEDFDTLVAKWRGYGRWGSTWVDWRWVLGNQVS